jgi:hypothetical protein
MMRFVRLSSLAALALLGACGDVKSVMALSSALQTQYHLPANVRINNGSHLAITFQNADRTLKLDSLGRASFARDVAAFAKAHYSKASSLTDVTVAFANVSSTGPVTITRGEGQYVFQSSELP